MGTLADALERTDGADESTNSGGKGEGDKGTGTEIKSVDGDSASDSDDSSDAGTADGNDEVGDGDAAGDDKGEGEGKDSDDDEGDSIVNELKRSQAEMRQILRVMKRENATLKAKINRIDSSIDDDDDTDDDEEDGTKKLSRIEKLQNVLGGIGDSRGAQLDLLVTQMSETQKYADIENVCSETNVATVVESAASVLQEQNGGNIDEIMLELEIDIWKRPNPYKYLYEVIKAHHPEYQKSGKGTEDSKAKTDKVLSTKAASSIQDIGGSGGDKSGGAWTADRIDRLSELELNSVPADIYKKYMEGTLK